MNFPLAMLDFHRESPLTQQGGVLTGPRQCGKTTLARQLQRRPNIFPLLRVLADRRDNPARFLILGSASGDLLRQTSESLTGRMERVTIGGFSLKELGAEAEQNLWLRGGLPLSYLARSEADSRAWRKDFIQTLLERDFPQWGVRVPSVALLRFWTMLAHYHGQTWNAAEPARAMGVSESTACRNLDLLTDAFVVRQLHPYMPTSANGRSKPRRSMSGTLGSCISF